ncbi:AraC family ligand binding domain-containing protein [Paenibacillus sp. 1A_MP2]|uniref:AraC family ligand binding domain-containing protein n=1 Tax=Paenibacillus sp. 1A_MP2 TaxID=3457495 RepID=UPI003FCE065E
MLIKPDHRRYFMTSRDRPLPLYIESIGYNGNQESVSRPAGYPCYHWLQTVKGAGEFRFAGSTVLLGETSGILLPPNEPHEYVPSQGEWQTLYITFGGAQCPAITESLGLGRLPFINGIRRARLNTMGGKCWVPSAVIRIYPVWKRQRTCTGF